MGFIALHWPWGGRGSIGSIALDLAKFSRQNNAFCVARVQTSHHADINQSINQSIRTSIAPISPAKARLGGAPNKSVSKKPNSRIRSRNVNRQSGVQTFTEGKPNQREVSSGVSWKLLLKELTGQREGAYSTEWGRKNEKRLHQCWS